MTVPPPQPPCDRPTPTLRAEGLLKTYGAARALDGVSLAVHPGESVAIMGPSGSGKTTLMHVLSGIILPDAGQVGFLPSAGDSAGEHALTLLSTLSAERRAVLRRRHIGFVFQEGLLLPELTALENVAVALMISGTSRAEAESLAASWLVYLGLAGMEDRRPGQLSGGQAQRVAIARAQVTGPSVVFADEPTGALDSVTSEQVLRALLDSTVERGAPLVLVTHDETVAAQCSRVIRLRDGRVEEDSAAAVATELSHGGAA